jgi:hypothetical protein
MFCAATLPTFLTALRLSGFAVGLPERQRSLDLLVSLQATGTMPDNSEQLSNMLGAVLCRSAQQQVLFRREFAKHFGTWKGRGPPHDEGATQAEPRIEIGAQAEPTGDLPDSPSRFIAKWWFARLLSLCCCSSWQPY